MIAISTVAIAKPIRAPAVPPSVSHSAGRMNAPQPTAEPNAIANTHEGLMVLSSLRVSACAVASAGAVAGVSPERSPLATATVATEEALHGNCGGFARGCSWPPACRGPGRVDGPRSPGTGR